MVLSQKLNFPNFCSVRMKHWHQLHKMGMSQNICPNCTVWPCSRLLWVASTFTASVPILVAGFRRHHFWWNLECEWNTGINMLVEAARMGISHGFLWFYPHSKKSYGYVWLASRSHFPHPTQWSHDRLSCGNPSFAIGYVLWTPLNTPESPMDCYLYVYNFGISCNSKGRYVIVSLSTTTY